MESKMRAMAGLEYNYLLRELTPLIGRFAGKFYELEDGLFRLKLGDADLICQLGVRMHLTRYITTSPQTPSNFCEFVRKKLDGKKLSAVSQHGMDRIITLKFSTPSESISLVFEMFAQGNLLVLGPDDTILRPYKKEEWKDRRLARNEKYILPASLQIPFPPSSDDLRTLLHAKTEGKKEKYAVSALSALSIGTIYVNEALARAKIMPKEPASSLTGSQTESLAQAFASLHSSMLPLAYKKDGKLIDFSVAELSQYSSHEALPCKSLSQAADEFYQECLPATPASTAHDKKKAQLQERLQKQLSSLAENEKAENEFSQAGKAILANSEMLESLTSEIANSRAQKLSWEQIAEKLKRRKIEMEKEGSIMHLELG